MKSGFPTGTVTFLFTDIEGSARLWQEKRAKMSVAHARHNVTLRNAIESNRGYVFQVIGDAFCAAFHTAGDALRAVVQAQKDRIETRGTYNHIWDIIQIHIFQVESIEALSKAKT